MLWAGMILHAEKRQQIPESGSRGYGGHNGQKEIQLSRGQDGDSQPREIGGIRCGKNREPQQKSGRSPGSPP